MCVTCLGAEYNKKKSAGRYTADRRRVTKHFKIEKIGGYRNHNEPDFSDTLTLDGKEWR